MLNRNFLKKVRLFAGRVERVTTRFEMKKGRLVEHVTVEVPKPFLDPGKGQQPRKRPVAEAKKGH